MTENTQKPLILLDVDGPLNPYDANPNRRPLGYTTIRVRPSMWSGHQPLRVWLNPGHGALLIELAQEFDAELVWATTWEHDANEFIGPVIGLPELPVIEFGFKGTNWKFDAVLEFAGERALVWLDDDFAHYRSEGDRFIRARGDAPTRLHTVDPRIGLTALDLSQVRRWLRATT
jgi:hypothetical protein